MEDGKYREVPEQAGAELVEERDVPVIRVDPGSRLAGEHDIKAWQAGVNIEVIYLALDNHLAIVPNDMAKARAVFPA